ncbi:NADPH:quinone reductase [Aliamphritea ceti]|uniref:NADPH:quinone reductase n=1 Tax=Aliamphritea ceti TaxID=1524258 RepID=UPI0021C43E96|nr:NADPH:quinone reductase [Aliamphritea ceti]
MRAAWFERFGKANEVLQIGECAMPAPAAGEVLVQLHCSGLNPSDTKKRQGAFPNLLDTGAVIPNSDGAGVITAVGAGVSASRIGERVWVYQAQYGRLHGTAAEYLAIDAARAVVLPETTSFAVGACLGIPVMTAHRCVFADGPIEGQLILITGGAGRVGYYAIQWAKLAGATVIATASNPQSEQYCLEAGADFVVDHRAEDFSEQVLAFTEGRKVDRLVDVEFGANLPAALDLLRTSAVIATYSSTVVPEPVLPFKQMMFMDLTIRMVIVYAMPETAKQAAIEAITQALSNDQLKHRIAGEYALDDIAAASEHIEAGGSEGCVVINI